MIRSRELGSLACVLAVVGCSANGAGNPSLPGDPGGQGGQQGAPGGNTSSAQAGWTSSLRAGAPSFAGGSSVADGGRSGAGGASSPNAGGSSSGGAPPAAAGSDGHAQGGANAGATRGGRSGVSEGGAPSGGRPSSSEGGASNGGRSDEDAAGATSGGAMSSGAAGRGSAGASSAPDGETACQRAKLLWFEDFETGNYNRWTSRTYGNDWGNGCQSTARSTAQKVSGSSSQRSEITCAYSESHRGYGGLQFSGDQVVPEYTNRGTGIDAPYGLVNTFHVRLETSTTFKDGTWFSFWTIDSSCSWDEDVLTLGLEDTSNRLAVAHYWAGNGGERTFAPGAPSFPRNRWVRVTIYVNYYDQEMHVWQDGKEVSHVTFDRPTKTICQWHWGAYASADNDDIVLYEDDNSIWKLEEPWEDFSREPWFAGDETACAP